MIDHCKQIAMQQFQLKYRITLKVFVTKQFQLK